MKTTSTFLIALSLLLSSHTRTQTFQVKDAKQFQYDPSVLLSANGTKSTTNDQTYYAREIQPVHQTPIKSSSSEARVTAYYMEGYGANATWKKISLKVTIETNSMGQDVINVIAYMASGYWISVSYGGVSKTYGEIAKEFSYSTYVASKTVYFNI